jgi:hypothetical protein
MKQQQPAKPRVAIGWSATGAQSVTRRVLTLAEHQALRRQLDDLDDKLRGLRAAERECR